MIILIIAFLLVLVVVFFTLYIFSRKEIKVITNQLEKINKIDTNTKIKLTSTDSTLQGLVLEVNKNLKKLQEVKSEYKKMDIELRQAIANISHDLRTPLTSIMGYIQLIEDNDLPEEDKKRYIDIIKKRAKSLELLISSFYDFSRLESREYQFQLKSINLSNITSDIIASYYTDFIRKGIEPIIEIDERVQSVIGDENAVRRVVSNLIQNMLKYGDDGVRIVLKQAEGHILMIFENKAPDLKEEYLPRLFDRFYTSNSTRSDNSSGLGLAITKQFIDQMGHSINADLVDISLKIIIKWKIL